MGGPLFIFKTRSLCLRRFFLKEKSGGLEIVQRALTSLNPLNQKPSLPPASLVVVLDAVPRTAEVLILVEPASHP